MYYHEGITTTKVAPVLKLHMINTTNTNDSSLKCNHAISKGRLFFFLTILDFTK